MIQFNFTGEPYPSLQQQADDKAFFIDKLGPLKAEFDVKNGVVTFNNSYPEDSENRISFNLGIDAGSLGDFIQRWNEYIRGLTGKAG